jgi:hypothetical protein
MSLEYLKKALKSSVEMFSFSKHLLCYWALVQPEFASIG